MDMKELDRILIHLHYVQRPPVSPLSAPDVSSTCMHEIIGINLQAHEQGFDDAAIGCSEIVSRGEQSVPLMALEQTLRLLAHYNWSSRYRSISGVCG